MEFSGFARCNIFIVLIICSLFLIHDMMKPEDIKFNSFDKKALESELMYGNSINNDEEWLSYSHGIMNKMEGDWEVSSLNELMSQLGLTMNEAFTNSYFTAAKTNWEAQADVTIQELYGQWNAKNKWDMGVNGSSIRNFVVNTVWADAGDTSNISQNLFDMETNVNSAWSNYRAEYEAGLENYLDTLESNQTGLGPVALSNYLECLQATASAQMAAASDIGGQFITLEENKYFAYMARYLAYRNFITTNDLLFNEAASSNSMSGSITNTEYQLDSLISPLSAASNIIADLQATDDLIAQELAVPTNAADTMTLGLDDWQNLVESAYSGGINEWNAAMSSLMAGMYNWENSAFAGYTNGMQEWQDSLNQLFAAKQNFVSDVFTDMTNSEAAWGSSINAESTNLAAMTIELSKIVSQNTNDFYNYETGLLNVLESGSSTLDTINNNIVWITDKLSSDSNNSAFYYGLMVNDYAPIASADAEIAVLSDEISGFDSYVSALDNAPKNTSSVTGGTGTDYHNYVDTSSSVTVNGVVLRYTNWNHVDYGGSQSGYQYTANGVVFKSYSSSSGYFLANSFDTNSYLNSDVSSQSNIISRYEPSYEDESAEYGFYANEIAELLHGYPQWISMQSDMTSILSNSTATLWAQLYSGAPGTGALTQSPSNAPDLYLMNGSEMELQAEDDQVLYLKQDLDIAQAVMNFALSTSNISPDSIAGEISNATSNYNNVLSIYGNSTNYLEETAAAVQAADTNMLYNGSKLGAASSNMNAAESFSEICQSNYNAYINETNLPAGYTSGSEYIGLTNSNRIAQDKLNIASAGYYSVLGTYYLSVSNYNNSLAAESAADRVSISNYVIVREDLGMLEWVTMPGILGIDNNPYAAVSATNVINPASDYSNALSAYNSALAGLVQTSNDIKNEETVSASVQAELNSYLSDYGSYGKFLNALQEMSDKAEGIQQDLGDSLFEITSNENVTYGNNYYSSDYNDVLYNNVISNMLCGNVTIEGFNSMLNNVFQNYKYIGTDIGGNFYSPLYANYLAMTADGVMAAFSNYVNTPYEDVFRIAFGISNDVINSDNSILLDNNNWYTGTSGFSFATGPEYYSIIRDKSSPFSSFTISSYYSTWLDYRDHGDNGNSPTGVENGGHGERPNYFWDPSSSLENLWNAYLVTNRLAGDYEMNISNYMNSSGSLDASKLNAGFLRLLKGKVSDFTAASLSILTNTAFLYVETNFIANNYANKIIPGSDSNISILALLNVIRGAYSDYLNKDEALIQESMTNADPSDKLFITMMIDDIYSNAVFKPSDMSKSSFADAAQNMLSLTIQAFDEAYQGQESLQVNEWYGIINNMNNQAYSEGAMWSNILVTGTAQWDSSIGSFENAMAGWDAAYRAAWSNGQAQWDAKTNSLVLRENEWITDAVNAVCSGSADYISSQLMQEIDLETAQILGQGLPEDISQSVKNEAMSLEQELMPQNQESYLAFFNNAVGQSRAADVKFVLDGISCFTGDGSVLSEFNNEMNTFKENELALEIIKMKDQFVDAINQALFGMNNNIDRSDNEAKNDEFGTMIKGQNWSSDGSEWEKKDVTLDSTLFGGDTKADLSFAGYSSFTSRLHYIDYASTNILDQINGEQAQYNLLLAAEMSDMQTDYSNLMVSFSSHVGSTAYSSSGAPAAYTGSDGGQGELYRISWALAWYGYEQDKGETAAKTPFWDKNLAPGVNFSLYDVNKIGLAIALNFIPGLGTVASAAIMVGMAMTHDLMDYAAGAESGSQFGLNMLEDTVSGVTSIATAGIGGDVASGGMNQIEGSLLSSGVNAAGNLATSGLHLNANGQIGWNMNSQQWASWGINSLSSLGTAAFDSGMQSAGSTESFNGSTWESEMDPLYSGLETAGNWGINTASSFAQSGLTMNGNNLDWHLSSDQWIEQGVGAGVSGVQAGVNSWLGSGNLLSYGINKALSAGQYSLYQSGLFGQGLKNEYAGMNDLDLAGGISLTFGGNQYDSESLNIKSTGVSVNSGAAGPNLLDASTWENTLAAFNTAGQGIMAAANAVGSGISAAAGAIGSAANFVYNGVSGAVSALASMIPPPGNNAASAAFEGTPALDETTRRNGQLQPMNEPITGNLNLPNVNPSYASLNPAQPQWNYFAANMGGTPGSAVDPSDYISASDIHDPIEMKTSEQKYIDKTNDLKMLESVGLGSSTINDAVKSYDPVLENMYSNYVKDNGITVSTLSGSKGISNNSEFNADVYQDQLNHYNIVMNEVSDVVAVRNLNNTINTLESIGITQTPEITAAISDLQGQINVAKDYYDPNLLKNSVNSSHFSIVGEQGYGLGTLAGTKGDAYNDRISMLQMDSSGNITINEFNNANLDSTNWRYNSSAGTYVDQQQRYSSTGDGIYDLTTTEKWPDNATPDPAFSLQLNNGGAVPTADGKNNIAYPSQGPWIYDSRIHIGGNKWNGSEACSTILNGVNSDYYKFMNLFANYDSYGNFTGYQIGAKGTYYLFR